MIENMNLGSRFKILERDSFTCQYCGSSAPDVKLEVDHIIPKVKGGQDISTNLITACIRCNRGKSHKSIKDIKSPEYIELPENTGFISYRARSIRVSDKVWNELKKQRTEYGLSWNRFILRKMEEYDKRKK